MASKALTYSVITTKYLEMPMKLIYSSDFCQKRALSAGIAEARARFLEFIRTL